MRLERLVSYHVYLEVTMYAEIALRNSKQMGTKANIFATMINEAEKGNNKNLTGLDVTLEAQNLIVAGSDTTGVSLTYLIWLILKHPKIRQALEAEVSFVSGEITDAKLEELPLLNACIEEGLRLYDAAPGGLPRVVPPGGATLGGFFIPGGVTVTTQAWSLHRDPMNFQDPERLVVSV